MVVAVLVSLLQPYARYAYRAATYALTNASFTTLLQSGLFTTLGDTTYMVEHISDDKSQMEKVFLYQGKEGGNTTTITSATGHAERSDPTEPDRAQAAERPAAADARGQVPTATASGEVVIRFREFETTFANPDDDFRPRGEDEREMTLLELWTARGNPPPQASILGRSSPNSTVGWCASCPCRCCR